MKMIHVITLFLVVIGGLHLALTGLGINLLGTVLGVTTNLTMLYVVIGISTIYHIVPMLKHNLTTL